MKSLDAELVEINKLKKKYEGYYFISYIEYESGEGKKFCNDVLNYHPFVWIKIQERYRVPTSLIGFDKITKEEWELYNA